MPRLLKMLALCVAMVAVLSGLAWHLRYGREPIESGLDLTAEIAGAAVVRFLIIHDVFLVLRIFKADLGG